MTDLRYGLDPASGLAGRVAVVTGAGRGIGEAVARALAVKGVRTALVARQLTDVARLSRELRDCGSEALPLCCDVSDSAGAAAAVAQAAIALGPVDILVNNAASVTPLGPTVRIAVDEWAAAIQLNLISALAAVRAALPDMLCRGYGRIVNLTSGAAEGSGMSGASAYSASKAGLEMLTRNLAAELASTGVSVVAVRPGRVDTHMQRYLRAQNPQRVGAEVVRRALEFQQHGELIDPSVPAALIVRLIELGVTGLVVSVYDDYGRSLLSGSAYAGDGSDNEARPPSASSSDQ